MLFVPCFSFLYFQPTLSNWNEPIAGTWLQIALAAGRLPYRLEAFFPFRSDHGKQLLFNHLALTGGGWTREMAPAS